MKSTQDMPSTEPIVDRIVLWQDHTHGHGYNPKLTLLIFEDGTKAIELNVFGRVVRMPYVNAECKHV